MVLIQWLLHHILTALHSMCYFYQVCLSELDPNSCVSLTLYSNSWSVTVHYITILHTIVLHHITLLYFTLLIVLHYITYHYIALHCIALHYTKITNLSQMTYIIIHYIHIHTTYNIQQKEYRGL